MVATLRTEQPLTVRLEECRPRQNEIWDRFASDFIKKAELVTHLIDLGFALTADQVEEMEQSDLGLPTVCLTAPQQTLLARAEHIAREIRFLAHIKDQTFAGSAVQYASTGHAEFSWRLPGEHTGFGINWLPYSEGDDQRREGFAEAQSAWTPCREWLVRRHYAEFRQLADCCRLVFQVALTLSPDQIAGVTSEAGIPEAALRAEQRALLDAASRLYPQAVPGYFRKYSARFHPEGQFWFVRSDGTDSECYGVGWLPYSWE